MDQNFAEFGHFIWSVAGLLRRDYKQPPDERKELREVVGKMNYLFSGNIGEADLVGALTTWKGHLLANEKLAEQAKNNSEEQFAMGDFKDVLTGIVIDSQAAQNNIAEQILKDERIFGVMQRMLAEMVWQQFQNQPKTGNSG